MTARAEGASARVAGLDGCRRGWVMVSASADQRGPSTVEGVVDLDDVITRLERGELAAVGIDIPVGLPDGGGRRCDVEARVLIGPRRSSVFPAPLRWILGSRTYEEASARSRALSGKGLSRQAFGIVPKVREVDLVMTPKRQHHLVEVHPEVSFATLAGVPMAHAKKTPAGRAERLDVLRRVFPDIDEGAESRVHGAAPDDVLDAFAVAWTARRWLAGSHVRLGGERDAWGLRMEIIV